MKQKVKEAVVLGLLVLFSVVLWLTLSVLLPKLSWDESALIASAITATVLLFVLWGLTAMVITDGFWVVFAWAIVSFSDAHSPQKLGREMTVFEENVKSKTKNEKPQLLRTRCANKKVIFIV